MNDNNKDLNNYTEKLSEYIDRLNEEKKPKQHGNQQDPPELERLYETVRKVRNLREPAMPEGDFSQKLALNTAARLNQRNSQRKAAMPFRKKWYFNAAAAALVIITLTLFGYTGLFNKDNVVMAMEQAIDEVKAYHGILEFVQSNAEGQNTVQTKMEVWADKKGRYFVEVLEGTQAGLITVNNGQKKWQIRPEEKEVYEFSAFPDPYRFVFELGDEVEEAKNAEKTKVIGEETVSGRKAKVLEVYPKGGVPYKLWIDSRTQLPLKKQSGMVNALQYTVAYTEIDFIDEIPAEQLDYSTPEGYTEVAANPEQIVASVVEAGEIAGFEPAVLKSIPASYYEENVSVETEKKIVKISYSTFDKQKKVVILQSRAEVDFSPASRAALGKVGGRHAEFQSPVGADSSILEPYGGVYGLKSIRWQQDGYEYAVVGNEAFDTLARFVENLGAGEVHLPESMENTGKPQVEVPVDLEVEENEQKSVDAGHSPWKLDPVYVAQVFVSLKMSPEGIQGDYPVAYEELKVLHNNGVEAVIEVTGDKTPIRKVYLKKLIRQDSTGIWTVIGYDPA